MRLLGELAEIVLQAAEANPFLTHRCGKRFKVGRYWVDVDYPNGPPPRFMRSG